MKKSILAVAVCLCTYSIAQAQFYVEVAAGYNFGFNGNYQIGNYSSHAVNNFDDGSFSSTGSQEALCLSLGKGVGFGATFGYDFNPFMGAELGVGYLMGAPTEATSQFSSELISGGDVFFEQSRYENNISGRSIQFIPSFVLHTDKEKVNLYTRLGVLVGINTMTNESNGVIENNTMRTTEVMKREWSGGVSLGFVARPGVRFALSDQFALFAEASIIASNYVPTKGEVTAFTVNGEDQLPNLTRSQKEVEFVDKLMYDSNTLENPDTPQQQTKNSFAFSSIGLQIGGRFTLGK